MQRAFAGQASFGRSASKTEWVYGFKVALVVDPNGVITTFSLATASSDQRPIADALIAEDRHDAYLADKGFTGVEWERRWMEIYGALVAATPKDASRRAWPEADRRWASGKRQIIEGLLLSGESPGEDLERAAGSPGGQGSGLHLRTTNQLSPGQTDASPGGPPDIAHCTSVV